MARKRFTLKDIATIALFLVVPFFLTGCSLKSSSSKKTTTAANQTLTIWRLNTDEKAFEPILDAYKKANPTVTVTYRTFAPTDDYEGTVLNAIAAGSGPDIWEIRNDELPRHADKLYGVPMTKGGIEILKKTYSPALTDEMVAGDALYGLPIAIDPLVLFMNEDHLQKAAIRTVPSTWDETIALATALTVKGDSGILRPGLALGTSGNIDRASEIMQLLMLQAGTQMIDPAHRQAIFAIQSQDPTTKAFDYPARDAVDFYKSFADATSGYQSWDATQPYSTQAFAAGNLSMMINYASLAPQMKLLNNKLKFKVSSLPQIITKRVPVGDVPASVSKPVYTAKYRALVVTKSQAKLSKTKQKARETTAWKFIQFVTNQANSQVYATKTNMVPLIPNADTSTSTKASISAAINPNLVAWYKGKNPRTVDQVFQAALSAITEQGQPTEDVLKQAAAAISGILQ